MLSSDCLYTLHSAYLTVLTKYLFLLFLCYCSFIQHPASSHLDTQSAFYFVNSSLFSVCRSVLGSFYLPVDMSICPSVTLSLSLGIVTDRNVIMNDFGCCFWSSVQCRCSKGIKLHRKKNIDVLKKKRKD